MSPRACFHTRSRRPHHRSYAYVNFSSSADAEKALMELNYAPVKGRPCRIMWSQRDPATRRSAVANIFVKNLGPSVTSQVRRWRSDGAATARRWRGDVAA